MRVGRLPAKMNDVTRTSGLLCGCLLLLAGCAQSRAGSETVDPDLLPLVSEATPAPTVFEPDEYIGPPEAPGLDLIGEDPPARQGPTQHVQLTEDPSGADTVVAQPKRDKMPSMMGGLLWGPRKH